MRTVRDSRLCPPGAGGLGGDVASVQADQLHMKGTLRTSAATSHSVHEIRSPAGTVVREYVSSASKVFAIAWRGHWPPDMRQLLGDYFDQYAQAAKAQGSVRTGRRPIAIEQPGLVVQMGGHVRSFRGRAYIAGRRAERSQRDCALLGVLKRPDSQEKKSYLAARLD